MYTCLAHFMSISWTWNGNLSACEWCRWHSKCCHLLYHDLIGTNREIKHLINWPSLFKNNPN